MTEAEWLTCARPEAMLEFLRGKASDRKLRLLAVACCRTAVSEVDPDGEESRQDLQLAEQMAEGISTPTDGLDYYYGFYSVFHGGGGAAEWACHAATGPSAWDAASEVIIKLDDALWDHGGTNAGVICLREIFGNPFRPLACDPAWLTSTVVALAEGIYADRAFDRMPILADALQDAGCNNEDILTHCRDTQRTHVRGCWVIDLLTGRG
jgi:hypothetical protein